MNRFEIENKKVENEVKSFDNSFRIDPNRIDCAVITFTQTEKHRIMVKAESELCKKGYIVSTNGPAYDGMVRWNVLITENVQL